MKSYPQVARGVIEGKASRLAFKVGQSVERLLIDRAVELAVREAEASGGVVVTADHVQRALDESLLAEAYDAVRLVINGKEGKRAKATAG
jgi:hypothetical protein